MYYADNPIVIYHNFIDPTTGQDVPLSGAVCKKVTIIVTYTSRQYKFQTELGNAPVAFDISSSARAELLEDYLRQPGTARTASISADITAVLSWMKNGEQHSAAVQVKTESGSNYAASLTIQMRAGGIPEFNRWIGQTTNTYNSFKPAADEIVNIGDSYYHNGQVTVINATNFPVLSNSAEAYITIDGRSIYVTNDPSRHMMVFLNSFCEFESFSLCTNESLSFNISTEKRNLVSKPSFVPSPNAIAVHSEPSGIFNLSSGFMSRQWLQWILTEFVKASHHWLMLNGRLLPVIVTPAENSIVYDQANPDLVAVNFTAESALTGPILTPP